jgi:hypothetical protein
MRRVFLIALAIAVAHARPASAQTSWGIGVLPTGAIYFCDPGRSTVWRVDPNGDLNPEVTGVTCRAIVTGVDGNIYGEFIPADSTATRGVGIWRINAAGTRQWLAPPTPMPQPETWLILDRDGRQYSWSGTGSGSAQSEIVVRDAMGASVVAAGGARGHDDGIGSLVGFGNVEGFALAPDGSLVIADSGDIRRMSTLFTVRTEAQRAVTNSRTGLTDIPGLWGRELGVATDLTGAALVVDPAAGRIVHVDRTGRVTPMWAPGGVAQRMSGGSWGWRPAGVAMLGSTYYVLDQWMGPTLLADIIGSPRLSQVDAGGRVTRIASVSNGTVRAAAVAIVLIAVSAVWTRVRPRRRAKSRLQE